MSAQRWMVGGLVVAVAAAIAMVTAWGGGAVVPEGSRIDAKDAQPGSAMRAELDAPAHDAPVPAPQAERQALPATVDGRATLHGRVVDEDGAPLAGVEVNLHGAPSTDQRLERYARKHGKVDWQPLDPIVTGDDGTFRWRFDPPPPYQWLCSATAAHRMRVFARWSQIEPGADLDCGDVVLLRGAELRGDVVDGQGQPQSAASVRLSLAPADRHWHEGVPFEGQSQFILRTDAAGAFSFDGFGEGTWRVAVDGRPRVSPNEIELRLDRSPQVVQLVVEAPPPQTAIAGVVVEDGGQPVVGAEVATEWRSPIRAHDDTGRDGRFRIQAEKVQATRPAVLEVSADGFDPQTTEPVEWGTEDARVVLHRGIDLEVLVTDAVDGTPVEDFGLRLLRKPGTTHTFRSPDARLVEVGHHDGGRAVLKGVARGVYLLTAEPIADDHAPSAFVEATVDDHAARLYRLEVAPSVGRTVRVVGDGGPVAGSTVELLESLGHDVEAGTVVVSRERLNDTTSVDRAALAASAETDAHGEVALRASATAPYVLRVRGPSHRPLVQPVVLGELPEPFVVMVSRGASLRGRIRPLELIAQLRQEAGLPASGTVESKLQSRLPSVRLVRGKGGDRIEHPARGQAPALVDEDGTFVLRGIDPGSWNVELVATRQQAPNAFTTGGTNVAHVQLAGDETRDLDLDLRSLLRATLVGRVEVDGQPWTGAGAVAVEGGTGPDGRPVSAWRNVDVDQGAFTTLAVAGRASFTAYGKSDGGDFSMVRSDETVDLAAGQTVQATFHVRGRTLVLHVTGSDGAPAQDVTVHLRNDQDGDVRTLGATDAHGETSTRLRTGGWTVLVTRRALRDRAAMAKWVEQHGGDYAAAEAAARIEVERLQVTTASEPLEHDLRLPAESGY